MKTLATLNTLTVEQLQPLIDSDYRTTVFVSIYGGTVAIFRRNSPSDLFFENGAGSIHSRSSSWAEFAGKLNSRDTKFILFDTRDEFTQYVREHKELTL